ncbi:MAG: aromatic ring-hydroxylating dioxygenase subunit alpha [Acidiferrobacterales bacterium]|nr:aromatic ring-hydroxylating dioxygenase subunit alpha [Acidiferrobacterales bacterium]
MVSQNKNKSRRALVAHLSKIRELGYKEAQGLPQGFYLDPWWTRQEKTHLFEKQWVCVGRRQEVQNQGDFFTCSVSDEAIVVIHSNDGEIRALSNVCRHRGTVIMEGAGNTHQLLCPYHHWRYDTFGRLINAPAIQPSENFNPEKCHLPMFHLEVWQGFIFICIADQPAPLAPQLEAMERQIAPYHLEDMHLHFQTTETWRVNWKILLENFMEGYHLSPLHRKTLHKVNPSRLCKHLFPGDLHFGYQVGFTSRIPDNAVGHRDLTPEQLNTCVMFAIPPGLTVGVGSDYSSFLCIQPNSSESVTIKMGLIFHGTDWGQTEIDHAVSLFQETMKEDKSVLLRVQKGMRSTRYQPGPLAPANLEGTIWDFYQYLARYTEPDEGRLFTD